MHPPRAPAPANPSERPNSSGTSRPRPTGEQRHTGEPGLPNRTYRARLNQVAASRGPHTATVLEEHDRRLSILEADTRRLRGTLGALARGQGLTIAGACTRCLDGYVLAGDGSIRCPACGYGRPL